MNTIVDETTTKIIDPQGIDLENIDAIESAVGEYIENAEYTELAELRYRLKKYLNTNEQLIKEQGSRLFQRYTDVFAKLRWAIIGRLNPIEVRELFEQHFEYFFDYPVDVVLDAVDQVLRGLILLEDRDVLKADIRKFISTSFVPLGKKQILISGRRSLSSVQNWIHDFETFTGDKDPSDSLVITEYLNTSQNVTSLTVEERKKLEKLLRFYIAMGLSSFTPEGNEDQIMYHDIKTGHIIVIDHGKEIDTGVPSDIVAKMTPEERVQAKKNIQEQLQEIDQELNRVDLPLTPLFVEQISRNQELQKAIADAGQSVIEEDAVTPRITFPEQPQMPIAPKKVEPEQKAAPGFAESIPVATTAQKNTFVKPVPPQPQPVSPAAPVHIEPIQPIVPEKKAAQGPVVAPTQSMPTPIITAAPAPAPVPLPPTPAIVQPTTPRVQSAPMMPRQETPKPPTPPQKPKEGIDYQSLAELVLAEHALLLASIEAENRFLSLIAAFAKGERTRDEVIATLTAPIESGGVNLTADIAASCLNTAERFRDGAQQRTRRRPQAQETNKKDQPTFQQVTEMMQRHKQFDEARTADKPTQSNTLQKQNNFLEPASVSAPAQQLNTHTGVEDIFANLDVAQMQQKSVTPETDSPIRRIDSIRTQQPNGNGKRRLEQVMGPMEELKKFSLAELRAFGTNPDAATAFIKEKIDLQTQESISKRAEAIRAWQESPLHQLYVQIGNASLTQGTPVNQYIEQRQQSGAETLTAAEFEAISSLNRQLRF